MGKVQGLGRVDGWRGGLDATRQEGAGSSLPLLHCDALWCPVHVWAGFRVLSDTSCPSGGWLDNTNTGHLTHCVTPPLCDCGHPRVTFVFPPLRRLVRPSPPNHLPNQPPTIITLHLLCRCTCYTSAGGGGPWGHCTHLYIKVWTQVSSNSTLPTTRNARFQQRGW